MSWLPFGHNHVSGEQRQPCSANVALDNAKVLSVRLLCVHRGPMGMPQRVSGSALKGQVGNIQDPGVGMVVSRNDAPVAALNEHLGLSHTNPCAASRARLDALMARLASFPLPANFSASAAACRLSAAL